MMRVIADEGVPDLQRSLAKLNLELSFLPRLSDAARIDLEYSHGRGLTPELTRRARNSGYRYNPQRSR